MKPVDAPVRLSFSRRGFLAGSGLLFVAGCAGEAVRSQSPEDAEMASIERQTRLIETVAAPFGMEFVKAEGTALVVGLADTGADPPPSPQRAELMADMQARGVINPTSVLASTTASLVVVRTFLPPAARPGDTVDLEVVVPPHVDTTSIAGGYLMQTRLLEKALLGGAVHNGHVLAIGEGPLLVDPAAPGDKATLLRGRVLGGGRITHGRELGLLIRPDEKSVFLSKQIGDSVNRRFHTYTKGVQQGVATPHTDEFIELLPHARYKYNMPRYMLVVRSIAVKESVEEQAGRLRLLEKQLLDPVTSSNAALRLEAVGKDGIPVLKNGLNTTDPEVRFYSAEALAYLDEGSAAAALGETARNHPAFRAHALAAMSALNAVESADELRTLFDSPSAETRYGAFRALWAMNSHDPSIQGEDFGGRFHYYPLRTGGPAMVHVTRSFRPEIVTFGPDQLLKLPMSVDAGKSIVVNGSNGQDGPDDGAHITVSRFEAGKPDQKRVVSCRLDDVIRAIVDLDGTYPDVVQFLQQAKASGALVCRFEVDALPSPTRFHDRNKNDSPIAGGDSYQVATPVPNLFTPAGLPPHTPEVGA
jgi:hypothetical protein